MRRAGSPTPTARRAACSPDFSCRRCSPLHNDHDFDALQAPARLDNVLHMFSYCRASRGRSDDPPSDPQRRGSPGTTPESRLKFICRFRRGFVAPLRQGVPCVTTSASDRRSSLSHRSKCPRHARITLLVDPVLWRKSLWIQSATDGSFKANGHRTSACLGHLAYLPKDRCFQDHAAVFATANGRS